MSKNKVKIACWNNSHTAELLLNRKQEEKLDRQFLKCSRVCGVCGSNETIIDGQTIFHPFKAYKCEKGHLHLIGLMKNLINIKFGNLSDQFVNVIGTIHEVNDFIDNEDINCHFCNTKLMPLDDSKLEELQLGSIKTKTRLGDVWDRKGIEPVRNGQYDEDGQYNSTRTEQTNKMRLRAMKRRSIPINQLPGTPINSATKNDYGYKDKDFVNPERLTQ